MRFGQGCVAAGAVEQLGRRCGPADAADAAVLLRKPTQGSALLDRVSHFLARYVAYPSEEARTAHALWIVHTHAMDAWESTPRICFLSPEPGSGKTRALEASEF